MKDLILELVVKFSESEAPIETGITLLVDGFLVSGFIISKDKFMENNFITSSIDEGIRDYLSKNQKNEPLDNGERNFIHLRDAKYYAPGQPPIPENEAIFCRIALEKISGFNLGILQSS
ncbi:hypothetical protein [Shewanella acanthi]|uniref:hypothetical protein n=1 Tax=Shewanella acanthi TaxID=2864212 RepID=UPI001C65808C|nr:hypothetical protein [Shewanella acanthi]MCH1930609.1 hypothetical protein [Shewanella shenzhenensis]QYJ77523.1 hypothetical protein K0H61_10200 [Shewanella acanthi]